jgi:hypothetical protein
MSKSGLYTSERTSVVNKYRSSWELAFMRWLDANDSVETWLYEPFSVEYVASERTSKIRSYTPDFLVLWTDGIRELIEIKPSKRINKKVIKKAEAILEFAFDIGTYYSIITEIELKELGVM